MNQNIGHSSQEVVRSNRAATVPESLWSPIAVGLITLVPGLLALITGQPLLFPSLAPTAALQASQPQERTARFYNVVLGHLVAMAAAYAAVMLLGAAAEPSVFEARKLFPMRLVASVVAVAVTQLVLIASKALHPPAFATVLLITLGGFKPTAHDSIVLLTGVLVVAVVGEMVRQARLIQPGQK